MGRKIPAKKHRGVKDPLEQQAKRLQSVKGKINAPPRDPDEQPVPRSLLRLFAPRPTRTPQDTPREHRQARDKRHARGGNAVSGMRRAGGESAREFSQRISSAMRALHHDTELHYPLDTEAEDVKGERMLALRELRLKKRRRAAGGGSGGDAPAEDKVSRSRRRSLKLKEKKEKAVQRVAADRAEVMYERVQFGATVDAPPALPRPRRAPPAPIGADRPARRQLLLSAMLQDGAHTHKPQKRNVGHEIQEEARERARLEAVAAYRALKAERNRDNKLKR